MGQIEKSKKKGRPSKADLAARLAAAESSDASPGTTGEQRDIRRSLRRRCFRYNIIDYDEDYLDDLGEEDNVPQVFEDDHEEEEEDRDDEDNEDDDDDGGGRGRRREKKIKLVVKLTTTTNTRTCASRGARGRRPGDNSAAGPTRRGRVHDEEKEEEEEEEEEQGQEEEEEENDEEDEEQNTPSVKKRRITAPQDSDDDEYHHNAANSPDQRRDFRVETKREQSIPGGPAPRNQDSRTPLPDKKQLELILDKLQKKDTYGVYAEPVDPEELPDYHDIIKHPMDFSTVRKKLAGGSYSTLEQFESDVFLISSNAMQYNAPDTIYHKQARVIKDLAERKFQRVRIRIEQLEKELKSEAKCEQKSESRPEQRERSNLLVKKLPKKPTCRSTQEPVGSDFSSGATLATTDAHNTCSLDPVANFERHSNNDGPVEGVSSLVDNFIEKAEDLHSGKGILPKFGRRSFVVDENRRATYNMSYQPVDRSDTIFIPFEDETKHLIPVGLAGDYTYARSLARYAANLGPIAWRIASKRIEQVLPPGFKYGRGWIGEYEPLTTTMLVLKGRKEYPFVSKLPDIAHSRKNDKFARCGTQGHLSNQPSTDGKLSSMLGSGGAKPPSPTISVAQSPNSLPAASAGPENMILKRAGLNSLSHNNQSNGLFHQQQKQLRRDSVSTENMGAKRVEPNAPSMSNPKLNSVAPKQTPNGNEMDNNRMEPNRVPVSTYRTVHMDAKQPRGSETPTSRPAESAHEGKNFLQSFSSKQQDPHGVAPQELHNGKRINNVADSNRLIASPPGSIPMQPSGVATTFPQRQDNGLSDPVLVMKMLTEKAQRQHNGSIHALSPSPVRPSITSPGGEGGSNAAAAAASAWMSVGAVGFRPAAQTPLGNRGQVAADPFHGGKQAFYPQTMQSHSQYPVSATMHFQPEKNGLPFQAFVQQQSKVSNEPQIQNRQVTFPQSGTNEASRFQVQASWRGLSPHTQQKQKQDTLPPDLNVAFQSVDSQQPDLALQL